MYKISLGIPTYEAGDGLVAALQSIYAQTFIEHIYEIIVIVDGTTLTGDYKKRISHPKLRLIENADRKGPAARVNTMLQIFTGDIFVYTNDDVLLAPDAVEQIVSVFERTKADLITGNPQPYSKKSLFHQALAVGQQINYKVANAWNDGNNYLNCNGRLVAFSNRFGKSMKIPETLKNYDAYFYICSYIYDFSFAHASQSIVYYQLPLTLSDHLKQSAKFQVSITDNALFIDENLTALYQIPKNLLLSKTIEVMTQSPLAFICYLGIFALSRLIKKELPHKNQTGYWETDKSTKTII